MGDRRTLIILGAIAVLIIGWAFWLIFSSSDSYNWYPTFSHENEQPYDFSLIRKSLQASYDDKFVEYRNFYEDSLTLNPSESLFFYLAGNDFLDSLETSEILNFAEQGGHVFISSRTQNKVLSKIFNFCLPDEDAQIEKPHQYDIVKFKKAKRISPRFIGESYEEDHTVNWTIRDDENRYEWAYFDLQNCDSVNYFVAGEFVSIGEVYDNLIEVNYGEGLLVFHTNPLIFTNIHFKKKEIFDYSNKILTEYATKELIYYNPDPGRSRVGGGSGTIPESPLKFILNHPSLKWGWYLLLVLVLLFVLNFIRRDQRSVPVQQLPENETANYLDVVSKLYQKEGKHKHIVAIQERLLLQFLRNKYGLTAPLINNDFIRNAAIQLELEEDYLSGFFKELERAKNNSTLTESDLLNLNSKIKAFYKRCP